MLEYPQRVFQFMIKKSHGCAFIVIFHVYLKEKYNDDVFNGTTRVYNQDLVTIVICRVQYV